MVSFLGPTPVFLRSPIAKSSSDHKNAGILRPIIIRDYAISTSIEVILPSYSGDFGGILSYQKMILDMTGHKDQTYQDTRQHLLKGAEELFARYGFDGTTTRMIARELGVNSAMVSYYFGSKEALYLQIFKNRLIEITAEIEVCDQIALAAKDKLRGYLLLYIKRISSNESFHRLLYNQLATRRHPAVIAMVAEARLQIYQFLLKIINNGIRSGHFKSVDAEIFALNILSFIPAVFTGNLSSLMHFTESVRIDISERMIDHILMMVIPEIAPLNHSGHV